MFKFGFYSLYRYQEFKILNKVNSSASNLFIYNKDQEKINKLNLIIDKNLKNLILKLKYKKIDFIFLIYEGKNVIHSSGVGINKSIDRFFYKFQKNNYSVIGPTFTNPSYRKRGFYKLALNIQIFHIINQHNINDIFISTKRSNRIMNSFEVNNLKEFSSGLEISIFNKFFVNIVYKKKFHLNLFFNDKLILKFG